MTDNQATGERDVWDPDADPDGITLDDVRPKDWMLEVFLDIVLGPGDEGDGHAGLTLQTNGTSVSGIAISRGAYMERLDALVRPNMGNVATDVLSSILGGASERTRELFARRSDADLPLPSRSFIHLRDARIHNGSSPLDLPLWRGTLKDVTGWALGSHNSTEEK